MSTDEHGANLPVAAFELLFALTWLPPALCTADACSGRSGRTVEPDGTKAARSGGWSFPTAGLAYKQYRYTLIDNLT